jgi:hypothetical protein
MQKKIKIPSGFMTTPRALQPPERANVPIFYVFCQSVVKRKRKKDYRLIYLHHPLTTTTTTTHYNLDNLPLDDKCKKKPSQFALHTSTHESYMRNLIIKGGCTETSMEKSPE